MISLIKNIAPKKQAVVALGLCLIALGFLLYLPADHFDEGQSMCLSVVLLDRECYACGMTRGSQHLLHLDFQEAWEYNKLSFIVVPLGMFLIGSKIWQLYKSDRPES